MELTLRLLLAALAGSLIGIERERLLWAAGLRTHMLVAVGACLIMIVSSYGFAEVLAKDHVVLDPSRVAAQVVSGIGFLGAGTILFRGEVIRGLTTAASLWAVAAIGLAVGGGLYVAAIATTAIVLLILGGLKPLEARFHERRPLSNLRLEVEQGKIDIDAMRDIAGLRAGRLRQFVVQRGSQEGRDEILIAFARLSKEALDDIARKLEAAPGVIKVEQM